MLFLLVKENSLKVKVKIIESKSYRYSFSLEESYIKTEFLFILTLIFKDIIV